MSRARLWTALSVVVLPLLAPCTRSLAVGVGKVQPAAPEFDAIVPRDAQIEKLAGGFGFIEGPIWMHEGFLLFSDIPRNQILKWSPGAKVLVYLQGSGLAGAPSRPIPNVIPTEHLQDYLIGSNGLTLDREGRLIICEHGNHRVERLERNGKRVVLADRYEGKRLNSPNDVVVKRDGAIYFTDPPYGLVKGDQDKQKELPFNGVYRLAGGKLTVLVKDQPAPNGLAFTPDEKHLYVDDSVQKRIYRYTVQADGTLADRHLFLDLSKSTADGVPDGMKIDVKGNVYCAGPGGIWVITPAGKFLGLIAPPEIPANLNWGDSDAKMLYMTARTGLYRIHLNIAGIRP